MEKDEVSSVMRLSFNYVSRGDFLGYSSDRKYIFQNIPSIPEYPVDWPGYDTDSMG
jgi:hypothetical protein